MITVSASSAEKIKDSWCLRGSLLFHKKYLLQILRSIAANAQQDKDLNTEGVGSISQAGYSHVHLLSVVSK